MDSLDDAHALGLTEGDFVTVAFTDNGVGMDDETRERCFEPLFTTKGPFKGTGMGLAAARRLAEESHGSIACRSQLGSGTTFEITFPTVDRRGRRTIALRRAGTTARFGDDIDRRR